MSVFIMHNNLLEGDYLSRDVSSTNSSYPITNAYKDERRAKVWRTQGYWSIPSNFKIVFQESPGTDLTATVTSDDYTSTSSFLTAIKTALDAAGLATYTVSVDTSTGKIKFESDLSGGAAVFYIMWTDADSATAASYLGFSTSANDTGSSSYVADYLRIHTNEYVEIDAGATANVNACVLLAGINELVQLSPEATVKLQGNETYNWTSPTFEQTLTATDLCWYYTSLTADPKRYWRLYIEDKSNSYGYIELNTLFLGEAYTTTRAKIQFPLNWQRTHNSSSVTSEAGHKFFDERDDADRLDFDIDFATNKEAYELYDILKYLSNNETFLISFDPDSEVKYTDDCWIRLVRQTREPQVSFYSPGVYSVSMSIEEVI